LKGAGEGKGGNLSGGERGLVPALVSPFIGNRKGAVVSKKGECRSHLEYRREKGEEGESFGKRENIFPQSCKKRKEIFLREKNLPKLLWGGIAYSLTKVTLPGKRLIEGKNRESKRRTAGQASTGRNALGKKLQFEKR